jgi:hypothetical protein
MTLRLQLKNGLWIEFGGLIQPQFFYTSKFFGPLTAAQLTQIILRSFLLLSGEPRDRRQVYCAESVELRADLGCGIAVDVEAVNLGKGQKFLGIWRKGLLDMWE